MIMGGEVLIRQENAEEWHRVGVTDAPADLSAAREKAPPTLLGPIPGVLLRFKAQKYVTSASFTFLSTEIDRSSYH